MRGELVALWAQRTEREQFVSVLCSAFIALAIAYAYVWVPVTRERDRLLVRVAELRAEAQAIVRDARELGSMKSAAKASTGLLSTIQQANAASKLSDSALEIAQHDSQTVRVVLASASAKQAFTWVARLQSTAGVRIKNITMASIGDDDRLRVQIMLSAEQ